MVQESPVLEEVNPISDQVEPANFILDRENPASENFDLILWDQMESINLILGRENSISVEADPILVDKEPILEEANPDDWLEEIFGHQLP